MSIGVDRVRNKIKFELGRILQHELKDPRLGTIRPTVLEVELTPDYRYCTARISILSTTEGEERKIMRALEDARGHVQSLVGGRLRTRVTPELRWELDQGPQKSVKIASLLDEIARERAEREGPAGDEEPDEVEDAVRDAPADPPPGD